LGFEKSQRSVIHDSLRYINTFTYLLTYLLSSSHFYTDKSAISLQRGPDDPKFQVVGVAPSTIQLLIILGFRMMWKSGQIFLTFCHNARGWRTYRQTDERTTFSSLVRAGIPCSAKKTVYSVRNLRTDVWRPAKSTMQEIHTLKTHQMRTRCQAARATNIHTRL